MGLETIALMAVIAGAGVSAYSSYQQGKAEDRLHKFNANQREVEAMTSERDGRVMANSQRAQSAALLSKQRAMYAKSGVVLEGTPLLVQADTASNLEMEALEIERTANIDAHRNRMGAVQDRMQGKAARRAGNLGAVAGILQGAGQAAGMKVKFNSMS